MNLGHTYRPGSKNLFYFNLDLVDKIYLMTKHLESTELEIGLR